MHNKDKGLDIYLMGIGGTGMGALAGLLKSQGHCVRGSDSAVYPPMKEKLSEWNISYKTPYAEQNLQPRPDLVIVGNVIRKDNPEAEAMRAQDIPHDSFPSALRRLFLQQATSLVASGTHGKTTCSALMAHVLHDAGMEPGFLIGGIPLNFGESFRLPRREKYDFVVEGDEYDTAYFDKQPKFMHYKPNLLLLTSVEFDHADIYRDLEAVIDAFAKLMASMGPQDRIVLNNGSLHAGEALRRSQTAAQVTTYGEGGDYVARDIHFDSAGIAFNVLAHGQDRGRMQLSLFGRHNLANALGCFAMLDQNGLSFPQIAQGFRSFKGVRRRLEERSAGRDIAVIDDFAHHPTAIQETIMAARQKYPGQRLWAIFEPRSATSCSKIFEEGFIAALSLADKVMLAPLGRSLPQDEQLDTKKMAFLLRQNGIEAKAYGGYDEFCADIKNAVSKDVLLFMSNGDFGGKLKTIMSPSP